MMGVGGVRGCGYGWDGMSKVGGGVCAGSGWGLNCGYG